MWIKKERGNEWYEKLRLKANQVKKWTEDGMKAQIKEFQDMIKLSMSCR